jgi:hemerythrin-like domain-containing protein
MAKTVELLSRQHREVLELLARTEANLQAATGLSGFLKTLKTDVADHFTIEEECLFPVLAKHPGIADGPLRVMDMEHSAFRKLVLHLSQAVGAGRIEDQRAFARDIIDLLRERIAKEEHVLFPLAERILGEEEQLRMDSRASALGVLA